MVEQQLQHMRDKRGVLGIFKAKVGSRAQGINKDKYGVGGPSNVKENVAFEQHYHMREERWALRITKGRVAAGGRGRVAAGGRGINKDKYCAGGMGINKDEYEQ